MSEIENKVANSSISTIDLEKFYLEGERVQFDIKPHLFQELVLREKEFREFVKAHNWSHFSNKLVAIMCSADAIVPTWAYMLLALALEPYAKKIVFGNLEDLENLIIAEQINLINPLDYKDARVVIKGCGEIQIPINAYVQLSAKLRPHVKSIMYGEPCSTVPLYKSKA